MQRSEVDDGIVGFYGASSPTMEDDECVVTEPTLTMTALKARAQTKTVSPNACFVRTPTTAIPSLFEMLKLNHGDTFFDLGCGDGRIVRMAALHNEGVRVVGVECNTALHEYCVKQPVRCAEGSSIEYQLADLEAVLDGHELQGCTVAAYLYTTPPVIKALMPKLLRALRSGLRLVTFINHLDEKSDATRMAKLMKLYTGHGIHMASLKAPVPPKRKKASVAVGARFRAKRELMANPSSPHRKHAGGRHLELVI